MNSKDVACDLIHVVGGVEFTIKRYVYLYSALYAVSHSQGA